MWRFCGGRFSGPGDPGRRGRHGALSLLGADILVNSSAPLDCCCSHYPSSSAVTSSIQPLRSERSLYIHAHTHIHRVLFLNNPSGVRGFVLATDVTKHLASISLRTSRDS